MYKIAVIGDKDSVLGFMAIGFDVFSVTEPGECAALLHKLARQDYAVIYITEDAAMSIPEDVARYNDESTPAIILIPGVGGSRGIGINAVKESVKRAVGADILFKD